jgi:hypothetical protein
MPETKDKIDARQGVRRRGQERVLKWSLMLSAVGLVVAFIAVIAWRALAG